MEIRYIKNKYNFYLNQSILLLILILLLWLLPSLVLAQGGAQYTPMVEGFPEIAEAADFQNYIEALYNLSISLAALLAVVKIIFGGVRYMLSDVVTDKSDAKKDIKGAVLGLLIVIGAVLILNTINPQLTNFNIFTNSEFTMGEGRNGALSVECDDCEEGTSFTGNGIIHKDDHQKIKDNCNTETHKVVEEQVMLQKKTTCVKK